MADHEIPSNQMRPLARNIQPPPPPKFFVRDNNSTSQKNSMKSNGRRFESKIKELQFNLPRKARISSYENGAFRFYVQFINMKKDLKNLQDRLKRVQLKPLDASSISMLDSACLIRHGDNSIFRAAIVKLPSRENEYYIVNLIDYGTNVSVNIEQIFMIPIDLVAPMAFALPCRLAGIYKSVQVSDREISSIFKNLTENKIVTINYVRSDDSHIDCDIIIDDNRNVADILNNWNPYNIQYSSQSPLENSCMLRVKVSYVEAPSEFYVHVQTPENQSDYDKMCEELYQAIQQLVVMDNPNCGNCCCVLLQNELYRGLVLSKTVTGLLRVKIIDYGITEEFPAKHVFCLPRNLALRASFSYQCCLEGFEALKVSDNISTQFDIFCGDGRGDRKIFQMMILKSGEKNVVKLEDFTVDPPVNVNNMLLKNSRPLMETIQLENSKKKQKDIKNNNHSIETEQKSDSLNQNNRKKNGHVQRETSQNFVEKSSSHRSFFNKSEILDDKSPSKGASVSQNRKSLVDGDPKIKTPKYEIDVKIGWVSTILSINKVFVHYEDHINSLEKILDDMFLFYENNHSRPLKELKAGKLCAAKSGDSNWYRSRIEKINGNIVEVMHLEYGNIESIHKSKLRILDEKFASVGDLVVPAYFAIQSCNEKNLLDELKSIFVDGSKEFKFKTIEKFQDGWILEPIGMNNQNVIDELVKIQKAERISSEKLQLLLNQNSNENTSKTGKEKTVTPQKQISRSKNVKVENITGNDQILKNTFENQPYKVPDTKFSQVKITALTSATDFFTVNMDDVEEFQKLHSDIQIISSGMAFLVDYTVSELCLVQQPFDQQYYRAQIIYRDDIVTVRCVDDGKTFSVDKNSLKQIPEALKVKKFFAMHCSLCVNVTECKDEESTKYLLEMVDEIFKSEVLCVSEGKTYVELFTDVMNLSDSLVSKSLASRVATIRSGVCFASHVNSISSFFLQMECDQFYLDIISKYFEEAKGNFSKIEEGKKNQIVSALYTEDSCWYRAKIEKKNNGKYSVAFIDFGNICDVDEIGMIEETIAILPRMSKHCSLYVSEEFRRLLPLNVDEKFKILCASGATILHVSMLNPGDPTEVELFIDGENLVDLLIKK